MVHVFTHTHMHNMRLLSVPLENSDLTELEVRSALYVLYSFLVHFNDSFYIFFSVEYHCTSKYLKKSRKMTNVKKKKGVGLRKASEELNAPPVPV